MEELNNNYDYKKSKCDNNKNKYFERSKEEIKRVVAQNINIIPDYINQKKDIRGFYFDIYNENIDIISDIIAFDIINFKISLSNQLCCANKNSHKSSYRDLNFCNSST